MEQQQQQQQQANAANARYERTLVSIIVVDNAVCQLSRLEFNILRLLRHSYGRLNWDVYIYSLYYGVNSGLAFAIAIFCNRLFASLQTLFSGAFVGVPWQGVLNDNVVTEDAIFSHFRTFRAKINIAILRHEVYRLSNDFKMLNLEWQWDDILMQIWFCVISVAYFRTQPCKSEKETTTFSATKM